jgi:hypothetical protein
MRFNNYFVRFQKIKTGGFKKQAVVNQYITITIPELYFVLFLNNNEKQKLRCFTTAIITITYLTNMDFYEITDRIKIKTGAIPVSYPYASQFRKNANRFLLAVANLSLISLAILGGKF